ncbi:MAG: SH3 domain-containing protein [Thermosynechococcaceae cyanobacterium]
MVFCRSAILIWGVIGLLTVSAWSLPVRAEEGELIAQDTKAQINVRSLANTEADIIAAGTVGDRVQVLGHSIGNDGLTWYHIKLNKSGQSGWIRGDLIKVFGTPKPQAAAKPAAPVPLTPPRLSASPKSIAPSQPNPPKQPTETPVPAKGPSTTEKPPGTEPTTAIAPKTTETPAPAATPAATSATPATPTPTSETTATTTIVAFKTPTYAVRIFSEAGQLRLNLFNRKTNRLALKAVPVESKSAEEGTLYNYGTDAKVTVVVPVSGQPTLIATALGETLKEAAETTPEAASSVP